MIRLPQVFQLVISITILSISGFSSAVNAGGGGAAPVQVAEAEIIELAPSIWIAGTIISRYDAKLSSEVEGRIESLLEVGDEIEKGGVIASIDDTTMRMQQDEARAEIAPVEAKLKFFNAEVERLNKLAKENNAAKNRLDEVISDRDEMRGELAMKQTRLAQARDTLKRAIIIAPFSGVVAERFKEEGEWAKTGDNLIRLVNIETKEVQGRIQQESAVFIKKGDAIEVVDDQTKTLATVKTLVPVGDAVSRLYEIRLDYQQPEWMAGHAVRIRVPTAKPQKALVVPRDALVIRENVIKVFRILENNTADAVSVKTGIANDHLIEVIGNITQGDKIVVRGNERLRPQQQVKIQEDK
ncbi:MAG: multidrug efflux system membrane fusion protein [Gammaproteobacteria bacterium]|jgi:multidrug efflux system membrane fusion protein